MKRWFPFGTADDSRTRLLCLPHAGAGASTFVPWRSRLAPDIGVCPVQLPGRETRLSEPPYGRLCDLVADLLPVLLPMANRPMALFGHSMGALVAFEIARSMRAGGLPMPVHLFVSGRTAPQVPDTHQALHRLSSADLVAELRALGGTPDEVLSDPVVMARVLPFLRADFTLNEDYAFPAEPPLPLPVTVYGGTRDPRATEPELAAWSAVTASSFTLHMVSGGHFAVFENADEVLAHVASTVAGRRNAPTAPVAGRR